ncbi:MAG: M56 family metallopeptidase [Clostridia bacterium]|nr:M56 family metallopeptidase [Clostridia bacterium]
MLGEIFYWIFNMSIAASLCALPIFLLRLIKKIPRRAFVWLWLIPFIRMCVPVGISSKYGIMAFISKFTTRTVTVYEMGDHASFTVMNHVMGANSYFPITYKTDLLHGLFSVCSVIWAIGALAAVIAIFIIYAITSSEIKDAKHLYGNVYISEKIQTPSVYGIIKPKIILPREYPEGELKFILMHETAHIRRGDNLIRLLALILVCVHWFDPLAWLILKCLYNDTELACDEAVLAACTDTEKKQYAHTLLASAEKMTVFTAALGGARIKTRIENIISYKKLSALSVIAFTALLLAIAYILLTNA